MDLSQTSLKTFFFFFFLPMDGTNRLDSNSPLRKTPTNSQYNQLTTYAHIHAIYPSPHLIPLPINQIKSNLIPTPTSQTPASRSHTSLTSGSANSPATPARNSTAS